MNSNNDAPRSQLLQRLFREASEARAFTALYVSYRDAPVTPPSILLSLGVSRDALSDRASEALDAIEELSTGDQNSAWSKFKWKLSAFSAIQDAFDTPVLPPVGVSVLFEQYYFYFESRNILAESVLAGLNGLYAASSALLRPFLEFSLLQNYYYRRARSESSYGAVVDYFKTHRTPSQATVMRNALPSSQFTKPIRFRAQAHLTALSRSSSHPYHPDSSPAQHRTTVGTHSLEGLFFWHATSMILESALWVYYVNFPMLFCRTDVLRKFGYNAPVGVAVDEQTVDLIRRSLSDEDYAAFSEYAHKDETARSIQEWIADRPSLTDEQIRATWSSEDGALTDLEEGYAKHMSKLRAMRAATAFRLAEQQDLPAALIDSMASLRGWTDLSRAPRSKKMQR